MSIAETSPVPTLTACTEKQDSQGIRDKILSQKDLYEILPFGKRKIQKLISANELPLVKVGNDYITTFGILENWISKNINLEIYYD